MALLLPIEVNQRIEFTFSTAGFISYFGGESAALFQNVTVANRRCQRLQLKNIVSAF
jgi:hypothetical protein